MTPASWAQLHQGPARTGLQPDETRVGAATVAKLKLVRTYAGPPSGSPQEPLVANGILYVVIGSELDAFDVTGRTGCTGSEPTCAPLWSTFAGSFHGIAVDGGRIFVTDGRGVHAYDAAGVQNCSGSPRVCSALWETSTTTPTGPAFVSGTGAPVVSGGVLYVPGAGNGVGLANGGAFISAFDTRGITGCTGSPKICVPMWTTTGLGVSASNVGSPAVVGGVVYLANGTLMAFDAAGSTKCTSAPRVCSPLWTAATSNGSTAPAPAVSGGFVYVASFYSKLTAFDAAGARNCTTTSGQTSCTPLWTAAPPGSVLGTPAVAYGSVLTVTSSGTLSAWDADASTHCTGPSTARTCTPLWSTATGPTGYATSSAPAVANGVVFLSSTNGGTYAFDAHGKKKCSTSGGVKTCAPLWSSVSGFIGGGSPAVVDGIVLINLSGRPWVQAFGLPPAAPTAVAAVTKGTGAVTVTFTQGDGNGSPEVSQTATCVSSDGGVTRSRTHTGPAAAPVTVTGLTSGRTYTCTVKAKNPAGSSSASMPTSPVVVG